MQTLPNIRQSERGDIARALFDMLCMRLEAAKQQNFHADTLNVWYSVFCGMGWNDEKLYARYTAVMVMPQKRKEITVDDWIHAPAYNHDIEIEVDAKRLAKDIIKRRRLEMENLKIPFEDIAKEGLIQISEVYDYEKNKLVMQWMKEKEPEFEKLGEYVLKLSAQHAVELFNLAVNEKLIENPGGMVASRPSYVRLFLRASIPKIDELVKQFRIIQEHKAIHN